jgi:molybdate/tungstate transport system substrate-binding protein
MKATKETLKILHAGALRKPMKECVHLFWNDYPGVEVALDYAGSRACASAILEGKDVDVVALADPHVFEDMLVPEHVDVFFVFATDEMVLAYDEFSLYSSDINKNNWMEILLKDRVSFSRSDHNLDPCGYRTLMVWQLAETFYNKPGLFASLNRKCSQEYIYPKSIDLGGALLEGKVDYIFQYLSVTRQLGFQHVGLPDKVNLSNPAHADYYSRVTITVAGKEGRGISLVRGAPIEFAVAIPKNSPQKELANHFVKLLTSPVGEKILEDCGLIPC